MTREALYLLWTLEERLVGAGVASEAADARTAELEAAGLVVQALKDVWLLTSRGWRVAAELRRFRAEHAEEIRTGLDIAAAFTPPADEDEKRVVAELAREIHARRSAADPAADPKDSFAAAVAFRQEEQAR